jgi:hypothetical protein
VSIVPPTSGPVRARISAIALRRGRSQLANSAAQDRGYRSGDAASARSSTVGKLTDIEPAMTCAGRRDGLKALRANASAARFRAAGRAEAVRQS